MWKYVNTQLHTATVTTISWIMSSWLLTVMKSWIDPIKPQVDLQNGISAWHVTLRGICPFSWGCNEREIGSTEPASTPGSSSSCSTALLSSCPSRHKCVTRINCVYEHNMYVSYYQLATFPKFELEDSNSDSNKHERERMKRHVTWLQPMRSPA